MTRSLSLAKLTRRPRVLIAMGSVAALVALFVLATAPAFAVDPAKPLSLCVKTLNGQLRASSTCDANEFRVDVVTENIMEVLFAVMRQSLLDAQEDLKAMTERIESERAEAQARFLSVESRLTAVQGRLANVELIVARVDSDDDGFPDVNDQCPTASGVAPDGCPVH